MLGEVKQTFGVLRTDAGCECAFAGEGARCQQQLCADTGTFWKCFHSLAQDIFACCEGQSNAAMPARANDSVRPSYIL